jgi:hypothetical protein
MMRPKVEQNPKYRKRSKEDKDAITAGIYQNYDQAKKRRLRQEYAGKEKGFMSLKSFLRLRGYFAALELKSVKALPSQRDEAGWPKSPPKGYPENRGQYADPRNFKYPLDTEDHVRAAWSYIHMPKNRAKYQPHELATMEARIQKAGKKYKIDFSDKDFGGWTSHNSDWERGFREGERKSEDRMRGIHTSRDREAQFQKKQAQPLTWSTNVDDPVREMQKAERQEALRYRAGKGKEQHEGVGKVPAAPGGPTRPRPAAFKPKPPKPKFFRSQRSVLYLPIALKVATKSFSGVQKGDLVVEGIVSMPVKDLQGDVLELPALIKAKNEMTKPPYNHVWLDHESPYAKPQTNQETAPIGNFVAAKIIHLAGYPALWARMVVNKAHPQFDEVAYELKKGYYNAFSMEFVPIVEGLKMIRGKMANAISDIKYFATSLVRAPANEKATVQKVYVKAFANSTRFCPVQVSGPGWVGQTILCKSIGGEENLGRIKRTITEEKELEPEDEPELEPEDEPELEPEDEPEPGDDGTDGDGSGAPGQTPTAMRGLKKRDYDRETGNTAAERVSTGMGEWGDPALDKRRAKRATIKDYIMDHDERLGTIEAGMKALIRNTALIGKAVGLDLKGVDTGEAKDTIDWDEDEGPGSGDLDEQVPPETKPGRMKPAKQRVTSTFDVGDEDIEDADSAEVGGEGTTSKKYVVTAAQLDRLVRKHVHEMRPLRVGGFGREEAGVMSEQMRLKQLMDSDDGSIESQLAIWGL